MTRIVYITSIPLPPLKSQHRIVIQIEKELALVDANKEVIGTFEQKIKDRIGKVWGKTTESAPKSLKGDLKRESGENEMLMATEPEEEYGEK